MIRLLYPSYASAICKRSTKQTSISTKMAIEIINNRASSVFDLSASVSHGSRNVSVMIEDANWPYMRVLRGGCWNAECHRVSFHVLCRIGIDWSHRSCIINESGIMGICKSSGGILWKLLFSLILMHFLVLFNYL